MIQIRGCHDKPPKDQFQIMSKEPYMLANISQKKVLFITTKNLDYIRNTQEIALIKKVASSCKIIGSPSRSYFVRLLSVYFSLLKIRASQFDTVFIGFAPQLVLPLFGRKFKNSYIIIDFFLSLFDTFCQDRKKFKPGGLPGRFLHHIDQATLHKAELIICDTRSHGRYFSGEFGISPDKLRPLYLQADTSIYRPRVSQKPAHLKDKFVVLYFGSILPLQGVDIVLKAMTLLKGEKGIYFYFIGPVKEDVKHALCPEPTNGAFIPWLAQEELAEYIAQADLCLAGHFNGRSGKAKRTIPGKAYIYQAMKKPMVLGDNPANHELFEPDPFHIYVEMGNAPALANVILNAYHR